MPHRADELSLLQAQMVYKKRLDTVMQELKAQEQALLVKVARLEAIKLSEQKDLDRLEGGSLSAFFYNVIGKKDEVLNKERREAYAARVKYDAARRELDAIQEDIRETEEDLRDLQDCEVRYAQKLEETRLAMEANHTPDGEALLAKEQELAYLENQEVELEEAIESGTTALRTLSDVLSNLNSAKDWSHLDILGGKFLVDFAKHEKMEVAQKNIEQLQIQLQSFNRELSDVSIRGNLQVSIERMLKFSDLFQEGLAKDLTVQDRILQSYSEADQTRDQILGVLRQLQTAMEEVRHKQVKIKSEMDAMVLSAEI